MRAEQTPLVATALGATREPLPKAGGVHFAGFDMLRILAAAAVVVSHSFALLGHAEPVVFRWRGFDVTLGHLAVDVFFATSGFLIARSWRSDPSPRRYAVRRFGRIWPGLAVAVVVTTVVLGPLVTSLSSTSYATNRMTWHYLFGNLAIFPVYYNLPGAFTGNPDPAAVNGSLWTLRIEVLAYICVALVLLRPRFRNVRTLAALTCLGAIANEAVSLHPSMLPGYALTLPLHDVLDLLTMFAAGSLLAYAHDRVPARWWLAAAAAIVSVVTWGLPLVVLQYATVPYLVWYLGTRQWAWCVRLRLAGDPSYGMYIYAFPLQQLVIFWFAGLRSPAMLSLIGIVLAAGAGYASWHLVERPAIRLLRRSVIGPRNVAAIPAPSTV